MPDRTRGPRQRKHWHNIPGGPITFTAAGTAIGGSFGSDDDPATVLRMLGEYTITFTPNPVGLDSCIIGIGIGVVSSDAAAVGAAAVPDPDGDPEYPWLYWASHPMFSTGTDPAVGAQAASVRRSFDSGSMRKMKPKESLIFVAEYVDITGTPPVTLTIGETRVLFGV